MTEQELRAAALGRLDDRLDRVERGLEELRHGGAERAVRVESLRQELEAAKRDIAALQQSDLVHEAGIAQATARIGIVDGKVDAVATRLGGVGDDVAGLKRHAYGAAAIAGPGLVGAAGVAYAIVQAIQHALSAH